MASPTETALSSLIYFHSYGIVQIHGRHSIGVDLLNGGVDVKRSVGESIKVRLQHFMIIGMSFAIIPLSQQCGTTIFEGAGDPDTQEDVEAVLSTDRADYAVGKPVTMTLTVRNMGDESVLFGFSSGQTFDFVVKELPGLAEVCRWSDGRFFTQATQSMVLASGEEKSYTGVWDQKDKDSNQVKPGVYQIEGVLTSTPELIAEPVQIEIQ